ncbi:MAG: D-alanine--D-alanine ligase [Candidatus Aminicenantes bacterium]|nr:D-alanine--D-alanine ligase [Candidatus Aminicenantes bacterium]
MKIAFVYSSKNGMAQWWRRLNFDENMMEEQEPPPDWLAECDSDETIEAIKEALAERWEVVPIESDDEAYNKLRESKPDLVFNIAEGISGPNREAYIPTICEMLNLPYTGSDPLTLSLCLDKSRAKEILSFYQIPNPKFWILDGFNENWFKVEFPSIVKPLYEGSSKGIRDNSVVRTIQELERKVAEIINDYHQPALVEKFLSGREFTVGVLGNSPNLEILPIIEIDHSYLPAGANPIYSYEAKWIWDRPENPLPLFRCPAEISPQLKVRIEEVVIQTWKALRIRDWCRMDLRLDETGEPNILEVNPLPGILPRPEDNSCLPKAARTAGYTYNRLIQRIVEIAGQRYGLKL